MRMCIFLGRLFLPLSFTFLFGLVHAQKPAFVSSYDDEFALGGVKDFKVTNNTADVVFEERGDGFFNNPPDDAAAFIYDASTMINCKLQKELEPAQKHIGHLCRNLRTPVNEAGYRILEKYGKIETKAIISAAYLEMLHRFPSAEELENWEKWFQKTRSNADAIRIALMISQEFQTSNPSYRVTQLQECRVQLFMEQLHTAFDQQKENTWPEAHQLHRLLFSKYEK